MKKCKLCGRMNEFWDKMNEFWDKMKALGTFMRVRLPGNNIDIKAESLFGSGW